MTTTTPSPKALIAGRVLSGLVIAFLLFDAGIKIARLGIVGETAVQLGWPGDPGFWAGLGWLLLACTALYAWPRTAFLGAIRSAEHTSELQSLMRISYAVFCLKKKKNTH